MYLSIIIILSSIIDNYLFKVPIKNNTKKCALSSNKDWGEHGLLFLKQLKEIIILFPSIYNLIFKHPACFRSNHPLNNKLYSSKDRYRLLGFCNIIKETTSSISF